MDDDIEPQEPVSVGMFAEIQMKVNELQIQMHEILFNLCENQNHPKKTQ